MLLSTITGRNKPFGDGVTRDAAKTIKEKNEGKKKKGYPDSQSITRITDVRVTVLCNRHQGNWDFQEILFLTRPGKFAEAARLAIKEAVKSST